MAGAHPKMVSKKQGQKSTTGLTTVGENDRVGGDEIQTDTTHGQTGEQHTCLGVVVECVDGAVSFIRVHAPVDAGVLDVRAIKLILDDVEERRPLRKHYDLGSLVLKRRLQDLQHCFRLGALCFRVNLPKFFVVATLWRRLQQRFLRECVAAHGALVLDLNSPSDAFAAEDVLAIGDDGVGGSVVADGAVVLTFYV